MVWSSAGQLQVDVGSTERSYGCGSGVLFVWEIGNGEELARLTGPKDAGRCQDRRRWKRPGRWHSDGEGLSGEEVTQQFMIEM
jgi:hypothetical protein